MKSCQEKSRELFNKDWMFSASTPVQKAKSVLGSIPNVPAIQKFFQFTPMNAIMAFVMAKGKTGDKRVRKTQEKESFFTLAKKLAILNFRTKKSIMASPCIILANPKPINEAKE